MGGMRVVLGLVLLAWGVFGAPQGLPRDFEWGQLEGAQLDYPVDFDFLPRTQTNRVLIAEKKGVIRLSVGGVVQREPFLDIQSQVHSQRGSRGLLAIGVDRNFAAFPFVYCLFAVETSPDNIEGFKVGRLSRFRVNNDLRSADPSSELILMGRGVPARPNVECPRAEQLGDVICLEYAHLLGGIDQDNNGLIYVSIGDNSSPSNPGPSVQRTQQLGTVYGKVLRVNRNGRAPTSNPWYDGDAFSNTSRTFALGFRNGFRIIYDDDRQAVWMADVGWSRWEEVNFIKAGENHEWPCRQAGLDQFQFGDRYGECADMLNNVPQPRSRVIGEPTGPAIFYDHDEGNAVTGVTPMAGNTWPARYRNAVFYTDYVAGWLRYNIVDNNGVSTSGPFTLATNLQGPVQLREGADGCIWYLSLTLQSIYKICYVEDTSPPGVRFISPARGQTNVERTVPIYAHLTKRVRPASTADSIVVQDINTNVRVPGTHTYDEENLTIKFVPATKLMPNRGYRITVRGLVDDGGRRLPRNVAQRFTTSFGFTTFFSDLELDRATSGGGPGRPVRMDQSRRGVPIRLNDVEYAKGVSVVPASDLFVDVPPFCRRLQGLVGVDDASQALEDVGIQAWIRVDGQWQFSILARLGRRMRAGDAPIPFDIGVRGKRRVEIRIRSTQPLNSEDTIVSFADLRFRCDAYDRPRPRIASVMPANNAGRVRLNPRATINFSEAMDILSVTRGVTITDTETDLPIAWEVATANTALTQIVMDTGSLEYARTYKVEFSAAVKDIAGNSVADEVTSFVWRFTTEPEPVVPTTVNVVEELPIERFLDRGFLSRDGFPRTVNPGMQTFPTGLSMRTASNAVFDLSSLAGRGCTRFTAFGGVDAAVPAGTGGRCALRVTSENTGTVDYQRVAAPRTPGQVVNANVRPGQSQLRLVANRSAAGDAQVNCNFGNARFICNGGTVVPLGQLPMTSSTGLVTRNRAPGNNPLRILTGSQTYDEGLFTGADLRMQFNIPHPSCRRFRASVQVDSDAAVRGARMRVRGLINDSVECESAVFTYGGGPVPFDCDISGKPHLQLRFFKVGGLAGAHRSIMTNAYLECDSIARRPHCEIAPVRSNFAVGDEIEFRANAFSFAGVPLPARQIRWDVNLIHCEPECHVHPETVIIGQPRGSITVPDHGDFFFFQFNCVVEDEGFTTRSSAESRPRTVPVNLRTQPPGARAAIGSFVGVAPLRTDVVLGTTFPVDVRRDAPNGYRFSHWQHNGSTDPSFQYTLNTTDEVTFTAIYTRD